MMYTISPTKNPLSRNTSMNKTLDERVIELHDIARQIEQELGQGQLTDDIRKAADRLSALLKEF